MIFWCLVLAFECYHPSGLSPAASASDLDEWTTKVRREKGIYHTLNKLSVDASHKVLVAEAWVPICAKARVHEALRTSAENSYTQVGVGFYPVEQLHMSIDCWER